MEIPQARLVPVISLSPAPWNPRTISDPSFENLCQFLQADPDFLQLRPILATTDGTVFAGNMRLRAAQHLGWETVAAILVDVPEQLAKERALRDNAQWGAWEEDDLAKLLDELKADGPDLDLLGFEECELCKVRVARGARRRPNPTSASWSHGPREMSVHFRFRHPTAAVP